MLTGSPIRHSEFLYETAPFPSVHASTIAQTPTGLVAAFFGGTKEGHPDVCIWVVRRIDGRWTAPQQVVDGVDGDSRYPTWNPVLFQPRHGPLMLFYKVGPKPSTWRGMVTHSHDDGRTWGKPYSLPDGILGPIKNKPIELPDGTIVSPSSTEGPTNGWRVHFEISTDGGQTWTATASVAADEGVKAIQPSILAHADGALQAIGRTKSGKLFTTCSTDHGRTWSKLTLTGLPNPNSGTDAVTLADGRHALVYNPSAVEKVRFPLSVAVSDDGQTWEDIAVLDAEPPGQYSYPAVIQGTDGLLHITYTWKRENIKYAVVDPIR
jgi:predicted neuraminidase